MLNPHIYIMIMAGGEGVRFAPLSTPDKPKQFHNIVGEKSLIRQTFERVVEWVPPERIGVLTNERYLSLVKENLPELPDANIHLEPVKKNTAPCIAYAAGWVKAQDPEGIMVVLPSDHIILDRPAFGEALKLGVELAVKEKALVTFGIVPTWPSNEYGYIQRKSLVSSSNRPAFWVERFVEKPTESVAQDYLDSGDYFWNSGMFVWQTGTILKAIEKHLPKHADDLKDIKFKKGKRPDKKDVAAFFEAVDPISIDYGVMERADNVITIPCSFGWNDIGTWKGLKSLVDEGNVFVEPAIREIMENECRR